MANRKTQVHAAANLSRRPDVIDVTADDELLATTAGAAITGFLKGVRQFFAEGRALEDAAITTLSAARALPLPTTGSEDLALQQFIRGASAGKKHIEDHWAITSDVHKLHRHLTAKRDVGVKALEEASTIANRLHNTYVEQERRRAQQEEDRRRQAAEAQAKADRDQQLAEAEAQAVALEEASPDLSARELAFVANYVQLRDGQKAAMLAGYKDPFKSAARLGSLLKIQRAIKAKQEAEALRQQAQAKAAQPIHVEVETVRPDVQRAAGSFDRTTKSAEIVDARAFVLAAMAGGLGIPPEALEPSQKWLNEMARSLGASIERFPGIRFRSTTKVV